MIALLQALFLTVAWADTPVDDLPVPLRERFEAAEAAWSKGELEAADAAFSDVVEGAPGFDRAWRRRCGVRLVLERLDDALVDCTKAVELKPSIENRTALAVTFVHDDQPAEAKALVDGVIAEDPTYLPGHVARCAWAAHVANGEGLKDCAAKLAEAEPGTPGTLYFQALAHLEAGELEEARAALVTAREKGLDEARVQDATARLQQKATDHAGKKRKPVAAVGEGVSAAEGWTLADLVPLLVAGALALTLGVLWFGRGSDEPSA